MNQPLDQLVYGWSEYGLEGQNRLQMVATSPSWAEDNKYRRVAQRLARLEAAGDRTPVSFGWADLGGRRFVFQRTLVPSPTGDARRLVAHIVAGDPAELPVDLLLRACDSSFWWRGRQLGSTLRQARPADLADGWSPEREPAPTPTSEALLQRILAAPAGVPATYDGDWRDALACLWGIQRSVPGLLDRLSCSTYETGQMVTWFDVAALDGRPRPHGAPGCARNATEPSYTATQLDDLAAFVAAAPTGPGAADAPAQFREVLRVGERIVAGRSSDIPSLLTRPETLPALLSTVGGVRGIADALWATERQQWPALLGDTGVGSTLASLALAAADAAAPDQPASLTAVARRLQAINPDLGAIFVERILVRRADGAALPRPDAGFLAAGLAWVYEALVGEQVIASLLVWAQQHVSARLLADKRVPEQWRDWLFGQATTHGQLGRDDYEHLVETHPRLLTGADWLPSDDDLALALVASRSAPLRTAASRAYAGRTTVAAHVRAILALHARNDVQGCLALLRTLGERDDARLAAREATPVWAVLGDLVLQSVTGRLDVDLLDLPWGVAHRLEGDGSWSAAVADLFASTRHDVGARMRALPAGLRGRSGADLAAMSEVALHDAILHARSGGGLAAWLEHIPHADAPRDGVVRVVLTAMQRRADSVRGLSAALAIALDAAVQRTGFLGLRVSAGDWEAALLAEVDRIRADDPTALREARNLYGWAAARWLRRQGAL